MIPNPKPRTGCGPNPHPNPNPSPPTPSIPRTKSGPNPDPRTDFQALDLAHTLGISDFKATNSWFSNFVKRYGLERMGFTGDDTRMTTMPQPFAVSVSMVPRQHDTADLSQIVDGSMATDCRFMLTPAG